METNGETDRLTGIATRVARVLVVDDDRAIRDLVRCVLELDGYDVVCAKDGQEALALLLAAQVPWVVLMDVMMPRMSGVEVCQRLRVAETVAAPHQIALMTAGLLEDGECPAPARVVIRKPFDVDRLVEVVGMLAAELAAGALAGAAAGTPALTAALV